MVIRVTLTSCVAQSLMAPWGRGELPPRKSPEETSQLTRQRGGNLSPPRQEEDEEVVQPSIMVSRVYWALV